MNVRQTLLVRTDLGFPTGLLVAQVSHIHFEWMRKKINLHLINDPMASSNYGCELTFNAEETSWLKTPYLFVHGVPNCESLDHFINIASQKGIPFEPWFDTIYIKVSDTQKIVASNCKIGVSFGPCDSDKIKEVIGDLPLL